GCARARVVQREPAAQAAGRTGDEDGHRHGARCTTVINRAAMIDHMTLRVRDYARSKAFYTAALAPLGYEVLAEFEGFAGLGVKPKPDFWIAAAENRKYDQLHIAFRARTRKQVDDFYAAALKAGAGDNGKPGPRADYHPNYYGAFVIDPDGHNVEAVCHEP